jgi:hypothetical protein
VFNFSLLYKFLCKGVIIVIRTRTRIRLGRGIEIWCMRASIRIRVGGWY